MVGKLVSVLAVALIFLLHASTQETVRSVDYRPPGFTVNDRIARISGVAKEMEELIARHAVSSHIPGVAFGIVVDDSLVHSSAIGFSNVENHAPVTPLTRFRIASMSKSFTAMAVMILRDDGKLSLDDPVSVYLPVMKQLDLPTSDSPPIRIEHLLTMTAGFPEDNPWGDRQLDESVAMLEELIRNGISFSRVPGVNYEYSNLGYAILGRLISEVSGMPYQEFIRREILEPLGMNHTYWEYERVPDGQLAIGYRFEEGSWKREPVLPDGSFGAMGGLITTIADFSRYVSFHLSAWPPGNGPEMGPLKRSSVREMHTARNSSLVTYETACEGSPVAAISGYGYGLRIYTDDRGIERIGHGGALPGYGSSYLFYPEYGIGMMAFGNLTYTSPWPDAELEELLFEKAGLKPRRLPPSAILLERKSQVEDLVLSWIGNRDSDGRELSGEEETEEQQRMGGQEILAENFYQDRSRARRAEEARRIAEKAGAVTGTGEITPFNQLRGHFPVFCEKDTIRVFFTLTPEPVPKIQQLEFSLDEMPSPR